MATSLDVAVPANAKLLQLRRAMTARRATDEDLTKRRSEGKSLRVDDNHQVGS
jgi:hypothetical protein